MINAVQQRKNQEVVANDDRKIDSLGGPVACPETPTVAIWDKYKPEHRAIAGSPVIPGTVSIPRKGEARSRYIATVQAEAQWVGGECVNVGVVLSGRVTDPDWDWSRNDYYIIGKASKLSLIVDAVSSGDENASEMIEKAIADVKHRRDLLDAEQHQLYILRKEINSSENVDGDDGQGQGGSNNDAVGGSESEEAQGS